MKKIKGNIKLIIGVAIGILISVTTSYTLAETLVKSADVSYVDNAKLGATNVQAAIDGTCTKFSNDLQNFLLKVYPVGSIYISYNSTNPGTLFGGTWENYGNGRVLKGINSGTAGQTGGSNSLTLKEENLPAHTHNISHTHTTAETSTTKMSLTAGPEGSGHQHSANLSYLYGEGGSTSFVLTNLKTSTDAINFVNGEHSHNVTGSVTIPSLSTNSISTNISGLTGNGKSFSIENAYITVYMWRRTA